MIHFRPAAETDAMAWQAFLVNMRWLLPALFFGLAAVLAALTVPILYRMTMDGRR